MIPAQLHVSSFHVHHVLISSCLRRFTERVLLESNALPLHELGIIPGKVCWVLYIDVVVLSSGGNLLDAISLAVRAALLKTTIPKVEVVKGPSGADDDVDFEISDDPYAATPLAASLVPVIVTLFKVGTVSIVMS